MAIKRTANHLESNFTTVPNSWIRDTNLTFRARGLLAMLMSHSAGWNTTISSLASQNVEGKDAILTAVRELEEHGYLRREGSRSESGRFESDWVLQDPPPAVEGKPETVADYPRRFSRDGSAATVNPPLKKNSNKKTNIKENQSIDTPVVPRANKPPMRNPVYSQIFEQFWEAYPRKENKPGTYETWRAATKFTEASTIIKAAHAYRENPYREPRFTKTPTNWLTARGWEDGAPEPQRPPQSGQKMPGWVARDQANQQFANAYLNQQQPTGGEHLDSNWIAGELA